MRLFFLFALLITSSFAANVNGEIITWGYGELIKKVFDSIQMLIRDDTLIFLFKSAFGIAFLLFAFKKVTDGRSSPALEFGKMMLIATAIWHLFLTAPDDSKHRYKIIDRVTGYETVVSRVPIGIGEPLSLITTLEDKIIDVMETYFSVPDSPTYRENGFGFPLRTQTTLAQITIPDMNFQRTFQEFIQNCTLFELEEGSKNIEELTIANNLLNALDPNGDIRLTPVYIGSNAGDVVTCYEAYDIIKQYIQNQGLNNYIKIASAVLRIKEGKLTQEEEKIAKTFFGAASNARNYLQQNLMINMTKSAFKNIANINGISAEHLSYIDAVTNQFAKSNFIQSGILAGEYLPIIKGVILIIIVSLSWVMALLTVMFMDLRYIKMYFTLLIWILLWSPILVIINYIGDMHLSKIFSQIASSTAQDLTLFTSNKVNATTSSTLAWLGYLVWLVPPLAYAIAKASEHGFVSFASSLAQTAQRPAQAGAQASVALAGQTNPSMRVGDYTMTDTPGALQTQTSHQAYGEIFNTTTTQSGNATSVTAQEAGSKATGSATFDSKGNIRNANYSSPAYAGKFTQSLKTQYQNAYEEAKSKTEQTAAKYKDAVSASIKNRFNTQDAIKVDASKMKSGGSRQTLTDAALKALQDVFGKSSQYSDFVSDVGKIAGQGGLSLQAVKLANGKVAYTFTNDKGNKKSITVDAKTAEAFNEQFGNNIANEYATSKSFKEDFSSAVGVSFDKEDAQVAEAAAEYSKAYQEQQKAQEAYSYVAAHGAEISENAFNKLFKHEIQEGLNKGLSKVAAVEYAMAQIKKYGDEGVLMKKLDEIGALNKMKEDINNIEQKTTNLSNVVDNENEKGKRVKERVEDKIGHAKKESEKNSKNVNNTVDSNQNNIGTDIDNKKNEMKQKGNNLQQQKQEHKGKKDKFENNIDSAVKENLLKSFFKSHTNEFAGLIAAGAIAFGGAKFAKSMVDKFKKDPKKTLELLKDLEERSKNGENVADFLKKKDKSLYEELKNSDAFDEDGRLKNVGSYKDEVAKELKKYGVKNADDVAENITKAKNKSFFGKILDSGKKLVDEAVETVGGAIDNAKNFVGNKIDEVEDYIDDALKKNPHLRPVAKFAGEAVEQGAKFAKVAGRAIPYVNLALTAIDGIQFGQWAIKQFSDDDNQTPKNNNDVVAQSKIDNQTPTTEEQTTSTTPKTTQNQVGVEDKKDNSITNLTVNDQKPFNLEVDNLTFNAGGYINDLRISGQNNLEGILGYNPNKYLYGDTPKEDYESDPAGFVTRGIGEEDTTTTPKQGKKFNVNTFISGGAITSNENVASANNDINTNRVTTTSQTQTQDNKLKEEVVTTDTVTQKSIVFNQETIQTQNKTTNDTQDTINQTNMTTQDKEEIVDNKNAKNTQKPILDTHQTPQGKEIRKEDVITSKEEKVDTKDKDNKSDTTNQKTNISDFIPSSNTQYTSNNLQPQEEDKLNQTYPQDTETSDNGFNNQQTADEVTPSGSATISQKTSANPNSQQVTNNPSNQKDTKKTKTADKGNDNEDNNEDELQIPKAPQTPNGEVVVTEEVIPKRLNNYDEESLHDNNIQKKPNNNLNTNESEKTDTQNDSSKKPNINNNIQITERFNLNEYKTPSSFIPTF